MRGSIGMIHTQVSNLQGHAHTRTDWQKGTWNLEPGNWDSDPWETWGRAIEILKYIRYILHIWGPIEVNCGRLEREFEYTFALYTVGGTARVDDDQRVPTSIHVLQSVVH